MDVTELIRGRRRGVVVERPSLRAQLLLVVSAFLCGTVLASLLFVGIWRHTAADGARAHTTELLAQRRLAAARHRLADVNTSLVHTRALLAAATRRTTRARGALEAERATNAAMAHRLPSLTASAHSLASQLATLESELRSLETYAEKPGPAGLDSGYLGAQIHYLSSSARTAAAAARNVDAAATAIPQAP